MAKITDQYGNHIGDIETPSGGGDGSGCLGEILSGIVIIIFLLILRSCVFM